MSCLKRPPNYVSQAFAKTERNMAMPEYRACRAGAAVVVTGVPSSWRDEASNLVNLIHSRAGTAVDTATIYARSGSLTQAGRVVYGYGWDAPAAAEHPAYACKTNSALVTFADPGLARAAVARLDGEEGSVPSRGGEQAFQLRLHVATDPCHAGVTDWGRVQAGHVVMVLMRGGTRGTRAQYMPAVVHALTLRSLAVTSARCAGGAGWGWGIQDSYVDVSLLVRPDHLALFEHERPSAKVRGKAKGQEPMEQRRLPLSCVHPIHTDAAFAGVPALVALAMCGNGTIHGSGCQGDNLYLTQLLLDFLSATAATPRDRAVHDALRVLRNHKGGTLKGAWKKVAELGIRARVLSVSEAFENGTWDVLDEAERRRVLARCEWDEVRVAGVQGWQSFVLLDEDGGKTPFAVDRRLVQLVEDGAAPANRPPPCDMSQRIVFDGKDRAPGSAVVVPFVAQAASGGGGSGGGAGGGAGGGRAPRRQLALKKTRKRKQPAEEWVPPSAASAASALAASLAAAGAEAVEAGEAEEAEKVVFTCERDCGFTGSYADVDAHEAWCGTARANLGGQEATSRELLSPGCSSSSSSSSSAGAAGPSSARAGGHGHGAAGAPLFSPAMPHTAPPGVAKLGHWEEDAAAATAAAAAAAAFAAACSDGVTESEDDAVVAGANGMAHTGARGASAKAIARAIRFVQDHSGTPDELWRRTIFYADTRNINSTITAVNFAAAGMRRALKAARKGQLAGGIATDLNVYEDRAEHLMRKINDAKRAVAAKATS